MKNDFYSYLDSFNKITIIINHELCNQDKTFCILRDDYADSLIIEGCEALGPNLKYTCRVSETVMLNIEYTILDESNNRSILRSGKIVRSDLFDMMYSYDGDDLGVTYTKEASTFKIWTPVAKEVELELVSTDGKMAFYDLKYFTQGVWQIALKGDFEGYKYRYNIRINEQFESVNDPYAISSSTNGEYNYIIDLNKVHKIKNPKPAFSGRPVDAIIYEASVRDMTMDRSSGATYKGKYLGMVENHPTESGLPTGLAYLSYLGITHLQLMPIFDFGGVDEFSPTKDYNWGYNPEQFNVPDGSYSLNPEDPYSRINEMLSLVDSAHANGLRVVMDVVYNHVYEILHFPFDRLVPGYFFRVDEHDILTEVSGCKNDLATERKMTRKFIIDSIKFWAKTYQISGFRFDLMGLIDVETINKINMVVDAIDPNIICYGEGWNMPNTLPPHLRANMSNYERMPQIGFFNDRFRDLMKGNQWGNNGGFCLGNQINIHDLICLFTGSCVDRYLFMNPNSSVNYVECHDNYTFYDFAVMKNPARTYEQHLDYQALAISMVILSQGVPFIHAGLEFMRTKNGVENSYNSGDEVNKFDWNLRDKNVELVKMTRDLIRLRKSIKEFRFTSNTLINEKVTFNGQSNSNRTAWFRIEGANEKLVIGIKNDYSSEEFSLGCDMKLIFDGRKATNEKVNMASIYRPGIVIYSKEKM